MANVNKLLFDCVAVVDLLPGGLFSFFLFLFFSFSRFFLF